MYGWAIEPHGTAERELLELPHAASVSSSARDGGVWPPANARRGVAALEDRFGPVKRPPSSTRDAGVGGPARVQALRHEPSARYSMIAGWLRRSEGVHELVLRSLNSPRRPRRQEAAGDRVGWKWRAWSAPGTQPTRHMTSTAAISAPACGRGRRLATASAVVTRRSRCGRSVLACRRSRGRGEGGVGQHGWRRPRAAGCRAARSRARRPGARPRRAPRAEVVGAAQRVADGVERQQRGLR